MPGGTSSPLPEPPSLSGTLEAPLAHRFASGVGVLGLGKINSHTGRSPCFRLLLGSGMSSPPQSAELAELARDVVAAAYLEGDFVLSSGRRSRYYLDKYLFETQPGILRRVGRHLGQLVPAGTTRLAAPELGAVLLGAAVSLELDLPLVLVRKEAKGDGTQRAIEGVL